MVVVRYSILSSKFAKIVCRPGSAQTCWGSLQRSLRPPSWIMGEGSGKGRWKGRRGRKGQGEGGEGKEGRRRERNENPGYGTGLSLNVNLCNALSRTRLWCATASRTSALISVSLVLSQTPANTD